MTVIPQPLSPAPRNATAPVRRGKTPDYASIVLWIRERYGTGFTPGMSDAQVRAQLEAIARNEQARGVPARDLKGFRAFIAHQHAAALLQVRR